MWVQIIDDDASRLVTTLYTGSGAARSIVTGQNLSGQGGLVWIKRDWSTGSGDFSSNGGHWRIFDTIRGVNKELRFNETTGEITTANSLTNFNNNGFSLGSSVAVNDTSFSSTFQAWSFLKKAGFMDIVGWEGTNTQALTVNHGLNAETGMIIGKRTDASGGWYVYHRSLGATKHLLLNSSAGEVTSVTPWANTTPTSTSFDVWLSGGSDGLQGLGRSFIGYVFAHNPAQKIFCGSFTSNGGGLDTTISGLGFEPKWLLLKATSISQVWTVFDKQRGWGAGSGSLRVYFPNQVVDGSATWNAYGVPTSDGFTITPNVDGSSAVNYIYMAIG